MEELQEKLKENIQTIKEYQDNTNKNLRRNKKLREDFKLQSKSKKIMKRLYEIKKIRKRHLTDIWKTSEKRITQKFWKYKLP
jgi:hypothetical protein